MHRLAFALWVVVICAAAAQVADACTPTYQEGSSDYYDSCNCVNCCFYVGTTTKKQFWNLTWRSTSGTVTQYESNYTTTGTGKCYCGTRCDPTFMTPTTYDAGGDSNAG